jgi:hypothetical protein
MKFAGEVQWILFGVIRCRNGATSATERLEMHFFDAKIFACEGFRHMQVCENCFDRSRLLGRGEGDRYERNSKGKFIKSSK